MSNPMNFVTFNQDYSCLAVGTCNGYRIYNCDPFGMLYENKEGDVSIIEMLFNTSLVALTFSPRRLVITNTKVRAEVFLPTRRTIFTNIPGHSDRSRFASSPSQPPY